MILSAVILFTVLIFALIGVIVVSSRSVYQRVTPTPNHPYINDEAEKWIQALESGKYEQQQCGYLLRGGAYCCLGVACEVGGLEKSKTWVDENGTPQPVKFSHDGGGGMKAEIPGLYSNVLGLYGSMGEVDPSRSEPVRFSDTVEVDSLAEANDQGISFAKIAAILRSQPELFFVKRVGG